MSMRALDHATMRTAGPDTSSIRASIRGGSVRGGSVDGGTVHGILSRFNSMRGNEHNHPVPKESFMHPKESLVPIAGERDSIVSMNSEATHRDSVDSAASSVRLSVAQDILPRKTVLLPAQIKKSVGRAALLWHANVEKRKSLAIAKKSAVEGLPSQKSMLHLLQGNASGENSDAKDGEGAKAASGGRNSTNEKYFKLTDRLRGGGGGGKPEQGHKREEKGHAHGHGHAADQDDRQESHDHHEGRRGSVVPHTHDLTRVRHSIMDEGHPLSKGPSSTKGVAVTRGNWRRKKKAPLNRTEEERYMQALGSAYRQAAYLERHTHFDSDEVRALMEMYKKCMRSKTGEWDRALFREIMVECFGIYNDEMLDRMFSFFDSDHEGTVSDTEWVQNMSIILRGTLDQHIDYCYDIYDFNGDHGISREELNHLFRGCLINVPSDEDTSDNIREIVELALRKYDEHRTGVITKESFRSAVLKDPLLLQGLGPCLPSEKYVRGFMLLFSDNPYKFSTNYSRLSDPGYNHRHKSKRQSNNRQGGSLGFLYHG